MASIIAQEKGDEKILADVSLIKGEYFRLTSQNEDALKAYEEAFSVYQKLGDLSGQGAACHMIGDIYLYTGDNEAALKMYDKALALYKKDR